MSRIGKVPIPVPAGVDVKIDGLAVVVKGPKGTLQRVFPDKVTIKREAAELVVGRVNDSPTARAMHGLSRTLLSNMVVGVTTGFVRDLEISGTGYRGQLNGKKLNLSLGFSHPVEIDPPEGISFALETPVKLRVAGLDKQLVGEVASRIRRLRVPDPYKAKGIKYANERIRRKAGKAGKVGAKA